MKSASRALPRRIRRESAYAPKCANAQTVSPAAATASARSGSKASAIHAATAADPVSAASPYAVLPESRPLAATANDAASTTIATAKPIENATATATIVGTSILGHVELVEELDRIAAVAEGYAGEGERLAGVLPAEPDPGARVYVCAFERGDDRSWLALDREGAPLLSRARVRDAVSIAALCELADENAGGGDLSDLRSRLVSLRLTEHVDGIAEVEEAALALESVVGSPPRVATPAHLDAVGAATLRLERALGETAASPFAAAMQQARVAVDELALEVETGYKLPLE